MTRPTRKQVLWVVLTMAVGLTAAPDTSRAQRLILPPHTVRVQRAPTYRPAPRGSMQARAGMYAPSMRATQYYFPQYTGGFHARYYDGIPSLYGTRPLRGTAW